MDICVTAVDEVGEKLDIGDTPLEISTEVMEDKESKEEDGSEVIKVYIFKAEADDDLGKCLLNLPVSQSAGSTSFLQHEKLPLNLFLWM